MAHIFGMLKIRNEARWIRQVIQAILPICEKVFVLDDGSSDGSDDICEQEGCTVYRGVIPRMTVGNQTVSDERAGKEFLLAQLYAAIPPREQHWTAGNPRSPYWALAIDGDEELMSGSAAAIEYATSAENVHSYHLRIPFLWNDPQRIRVDRVYRHFERLGRPSLFRLMNQDFRFLKTPFGRTADGKPVNFHCSSIPQELLYCAQPCKARLLHWGYLKAEDRMRKYLWYNEIDPNNAAEDCYRHIIQGDVPHIPADARLLHAGPMEFEALT